jgi:3-oxoacyl-[acyl-carrier protein] reductase
MDLGIEGRAALVAAASKGLGRAVALSLVKEGCRVSICSRSQEALDDARAELVAARDGATVHTFVCDVSKAEELAGWVTAATADLGTVDILVTNTGGPPAGRFAELTDETWQTGIDGTLLNVVRLCRLVLPGMRARKWGRIVHISSLAAKQPIDLLTISSTLRAGLSALTKTMANQVAADNVLVNAILPGHILTDRQVHLNELRAKEQGVTVEEYAGRTEKTIPLRRTGEPREIGDVVAFLASERASYITGATIQVDGGIISSTF